MRAPSLQPLAVLGNFPCVETFFDLIFPLRSSDFTLFLARLGDLMPPQQSWRVGGHQAFFRKALGPPYLCKRGRVRMIETGWMSTSTSAPFDCPIVVVSPCDFERLGLLFFQVFLKGYVAKGGIPTVLTVRVGWGG